jgi:hypothetical protein
MSFVKEGEKRTFPFSIHYRFLFRVDLGVGIELCSFIAAELTFPFPKAQRKPAFWNLYSLAL